MVERATCALLIQMPAFARLSGTRHRHPSRRSRYCWYRRRTPRRLGPRVTVEVHGHLTAATSPRALPSALMTSRTRTLPAEGPSSAYRGVSNEGPVARRAQVLESEEGARSAECLEPLLAFSKQRRPVPTAGVTARASSVVTASIW